MKELDIAIRMKDYEKVANYKLTKKVPIILRLDGKSFHSLCKHRNKPFDEEITTAMQLTLIDLCKNIQGVMCGYTQSDEVTLVLSDYARPETSAYFDYRVQKLCSVSAAIAATSFNKSLIFERLMCVYKVELFMIILSISMCGIYLKPHYLIQDVLIFQKRKLLTVFTGVFWMQNVTQLTCLRSLFIRIKS